MVIQVNSEAEDGAGSVMGCPMCEVKSKLWEKPCELGDVPDRFYFGFPVKPYGRSKGVS